MPSHHTLLPTIVICFLLNACVTAKHTPKPIESQAVADAILAKSTTDEAFLHYLQKQGYDKQSLPLTVWGLKELTHAALFFHTKLDIAKQELALAELAVKTANVSNKPSISAEIAHSNLKNDDIKPWAFGLSVDVPIETTNKRAYKVEKATQLLQAARMDVAETAWQLRHQIATDLIAYHENQTNIALLKDQLSTQKRIASMLEKRVRAGVASRTDLSKATLMTLKTEHDLNERMAAVKLLHINLAEDIGIPFDQFSSANIKPLASDNALTNQSIVDKPLQSAALLNRIDVRRSLANYAAAEAEIKLQIANLTPDITLSPGILFDFGDRIWSLGFSSLLNAINKNTALVDEATQLREIQGAKFKHLQSQVINKLNKALANYQAASQTLSQAEEQQFTQSAQLQKMQKQFDAGLIGKVELEEFALNSIVAKQQVSASTFKLLRSANAIENVIQKPLHTPFNTPSMDNK